ncbi:hypothetical protein BC826DRAFT_966379 [Russula brevipes]|nr:hypothetical protein BC826DRAFT_966379 [Russula brevipes]
MPQQHRMQPFSARVATPLPQGPSERRKPKLAFLEAKRGRIKASGTGICNGVGLEIKRCIPWAIYRGSPILRSTSTTQLEKCLLVRHATDVVSKAGREEPPPRVTRVYWVDLRGKLLASAGWPAQPRKHKVYLIASAPRTGTAAQGSLGERERRSECNVGSREWQNDPCTTVKDVKIKLVSGRSR